MLWLCLFVCLSISVETENHFTPSQKYRIQQCWSALWVVNNCDTRINRFLAHLCRTDELLGRFTWRHSSPSPIRTCMECSLKTVLSTKQAVLVYRDIFWWIFLNLAQHPRFCDLTRNVLCPRIAKSSVQYLLLGFVPNFMFWINKTSTGFLSSVFRNLRNDYRNWCCYPNSL